MTLSTENQAPPPGAAGPFRSRVRNEAAGGLAAHRAGAGPALVLIHGVGLRAEAWGAQIAALAGHFEVLAPDLPGHGESRALDDRAAGLAGFTGRIAACIEASVGPALIVGHSMGAMIALDLATRRPDLCVGVMPCNAVYRRDARARDAVQARAAALGAGTAGDLCAPIPRWFGDTPSGAGALAAAACRDWLRANDVHGYRAAYSVFASHDAPPDDALQALACPALFVTGALDLNSTPAMSQAMAALVPDGRQRIIGDAGHMAPMTHATACNDAITAFAAYCAGAGAKTARGNR